MEAFVFLATFFGKCILKIIPKKYKRYIDESSMATNAIGLVFIVLVMSVFLLFMWV